MVARLVIVAVLGSRCAFGQADFAAAREALTDFEQICEKEGTAQWGVSLCGRIVLVDPRTRRTLATARDPASEFEPKDGFFEGTLPPQFLLANTSFLWGSEQWAMALLPLPMDRFSRLRLLAHESFHRVQKDLGLNASDASNAHLDLESGRVWLRLELRALAQALRSEGPNAKPFARDALLFRAARWSLNPGAEAREFALEFQEGLAEYTGTAIALRATGESIARVARSIEAFEDQQAYARSFAYATGPALGLLLDRYAGSWRRDLKKDLGLPNRLAIALGVRPRDLDPSQAERRAAAYGIRAIAEDERSRENRRRLQLDRFRELFVTGPTLQFPRTEDLRRTFNPNNLVPLGEDGTVYPTGTFFARWGRLQVDEVGALLAPDNVSLRIAVPTQPDARPLTGPGWRLELAPGWTVRPASKPGSFEVVEAERPANQ